MRKSGSSHPRTPIPKRNPRRADVRIAIATCASPITSSTASATSIWTATARAARAIPRTPLAVARDCCNAPLEDAARLIITEGGIFEPDPGENPARLAHRRDLLERLLARIARYTRADRTRTLGDLLAYIEKVAKSEWPQCEPGPRNSSGVVVAQIDAIKGCAYESVFVPNLRAGAFPPYWVPDAFVYTTGSGSFRKTTSAKPVHHAPQNSPGINIKAERCSNRTPPRRASCCTAR